MRGVYEIYDRRKMSARTTDNFPCEKYRRDSRSFLNLKRDPMEHAPIRMAVLASLAALLVSSNAHAQSSVTLFGMLDVGVSYVSNEGGGHALEASDSIYTPSLIGLRGSEDLGGGYKAVFEFMSQFSPDTGAGIPGPGADFSREAYVGLGRNDLGTLTFGQQYNLMADFLFFPPGQFDASFLYGGFYNMRQGPFAALGIPDNPTGASDLDQMGQTSRVSNSVKFTSATFDGFKFAALYGFGGAAGSLSTDNTVGLAADYTRGNFGFGAAYNETRYASLDDGHDGIRNFGAGIHETFGNLYLSGLYTSTKNTLTGGGVQVEQVGGLYSFNHVLRLGANYQYWSGNAQLEHNKAQQITTALQYSLSKRTILYVEGAYQWTGGDVSGGHNAWINGTDPSSSTRQAIGRIGMQTTF
jgi:predicted porin